jgi:NhaA family Na+:H+ antiporter
VYLVVTRGAVGVARGWAIPAATDIAFALGLLALLGKRAPASLKLFLTTVAIVDDVGAVAIIALFYTAALNWLALGAAVLLFGAMLAMNRMGVVRVRWYLIGFALLWYAMLLSGVHATVAGVLAAVAVPVTRTPGAPDDVQSPLHRLEHGLQPWVAFVIVPMFGFANAGVSLGGAGAAFAPLPLGIALGLFVGKQAGVFGAVWAATKSGIAVRPLGASWAQVYGVALLCGIGFTMSLFIGGLAFATPEQGDAVKVGVLMGSVASAIAGCAVLYFSGAKTVAGRLD